MCTEFVISQVKLDIIREEITDVVKTLVKNSNLFSGCGKMEEWERIIYKLINAKFICFNDVTEREVMQEEELEDDRYAPYP